MVEIKKTLACQEFQLGGAVLKSKILPTTHSFVTFCISQGASTWEEPKKTHTFGYESKPIRYLFCRVPKTTSLKDFLLRVTWGYSGVLTHSRLTSLIPWISRPPATSLIYTDSVAPHSWWLWPLDESGKTLLQYGVLCFSGWFLGCF